MQTQSQVLSVFELTSKIKQLLEKTFFFLAVKGEASNVKYHSSGHLYFSLKDAYSQINCVMFSRDVKTMRKRLENGDKVTAQASLTVYPPKGNYQLLISSLSFSGTGELLLQLEETKKKLASKGYFNKEYKKPLPPFPKRIAVITSPTGAVIRDIIHVLNRRLHRFELILNPVHVQGDGAEHEISKAIRECNEFQIADVIILCRGGGSLEDLMPFNSEKVADVIFESTIPIISAVGHETDFSISDFVADVRAPTPSAAAEIASAESAAIEQTLLTLKKQIHLAIYTQLTQYKRELLHLKKHPLFAAPFNLLFHYKQALDDIRDHIDRSRLQLIHTLFYKLQETKKRLFSLHPQKQLKETQRNFLTLQRNLHISFHRYVKQKRELFEAKYFSLTYKRLFEQTIQNKRKSLHQLSSHLYSVNPQTLLEKGYAIAFSQKRKNVLTSVKNLKEQEQIELLLSDGYLDVEIKKIYERQK